MATTRTKFPERIIYLVLAFICIGTLYDLLFTRSKLREATRMINEVRSDLKTVSDSLASSQQKLNKVVENLDLQETHLKVMRGEVEKLNLSYELTQEKLGSRRSELLDELRKQEKELDKLKKDLENLDE
jgi:chromosome segregation ATPase